jgi:6-phosphogluconolactonase
MTVFATPAELFQAAAEQFANRAMKAIRERGRFCVALSGGSTPKAMFSLLASSKFSALPWDKIFLFWGDERYVPADDPQSNYRMTREALLSRVAIPAENVFPVPTGKTPASAAADDYEQTLKRFFKLGAGEFPRFDLTLNGVGTEGHTASLFPDSPALEENTKLVFAAWIEKYQMYRITLTLPVFKRAACVLFLAVGKDKAEILRTIQENPDGGLPAQLVQPADGELLWFVDRAAVSA